MARVTVVGGGLTGLAAAVRLAKRGHDVTVLEAEDRLGGAWAPRSFAGRMVDDAPAVIGFPAPWRDLFRKSGRPLEAELARAGHALVPAPPARYVFADGSELILPTDRGDQFSALSDAYGVPVAQWWRDRLDALDDVWQALRPLGLERAVESSRQLRRAGPRLLPGRSVADLADAAPHPHLRAIMRSVAHQLGSSPEVTPGWCCVELVVNRTFGRWTIDTGRTGVLLDLLIRRAELRRVAVHPGVRAERVELVGRRAVGVRDRSGTLWPADVVICTADPWQTVDRLLPWWVARRTRRAVRRLRPAAAPTITHDVRPEAGPDGGPPVSDCIRLTAEGVPTIHYRTRGLGSVHDFTRTRPDPAWGAQWRGAADWLRRPRIATEVPGLLLAGASSAAGAGPSSVLLSAALASAASDDYARVSVSSGEGPTS